MLTTLEGLLAGQRRGRTALGAFTCYTLEGAAGVLAAAARRGRGVVLLVSSQAFASDLGEQLVTTLRVLAERAEAPACLQLDHVANLTAIEAALELGVGAVMADGSLLPYEENAQFVQAAVAIARRYGAAVEAELGRVEGDEERVLASQIGALTDPEQAEEFVRATGAACLAVSIGNVHGVYARPPRLDWPRLEAVRSRTRVPLSLHGASGLGYSDVRRAIELGIAKLNVNTELRQAAFAALADGVPRLSGGARLLDLALEVRAAIDAAADAKLAHFAP